MELFRLVGSILVDNEKANDSLAKTDKKALSVGESLGKGVAAAGKFAVGVATAATAAVGSLVSVASSAADTADQIDKASQRMDISAESYQELSHAASLCGVEMSTMEKAAKKLEGTDLNMDQALEQIYALETAEERSAKAAELFGDAVAYSMSPMLNASAEDMANMKQEAHDLGLVLSNDAVSSGAQLNDALNNVKDSLKGLVTNLGASLMPIVKEGCDMIIQFMPTLQALVAEIGPVLSDVLATLLPIIMELAKELLPPLIQIVEALLPLFKLLCELILPPLIKVIEFLADIIANVVIPVIVKVVEYVSKVIEIAPEKFKQFKEAIVNTFEAIKEGVKKPINAVIGMINKMIGALNALSFDVPDWVPILGGKTFGFNLKEIPLLANGGNIVGGGNAIVGEAGPELINLPAGATVTPLTRGNDALNTSAILSTMTEMLEVMNRQNDELVYAMKEAIDNVDINWDDRQLGRLVQKYA